MIPGLSEGIGLLGKLIGQDKDHAHEERMSRAKESGWAAVDAAESAVHEIRFEGRKLHMRNGMLCDASGAYITNSSGDCIPMRTNDDRAYVLRHLRDYGTVKHIYVEGSR